MQAPTSLLGGEVGGGCASVSVYFLYAWFVSVDSGCVDNVCV